MRAARVDRLGGDSVAPTGETVAVTAPRLHEALAFMAAVATGAAWATYVRTLPGVHLRLLGAAIAAMLWAGLYAGLGLAYRRLDRRGTAGPGVPRRLGFSLLLALVSTHASRVILAPAFAPAQWVDFDYLRCLLPAAFVALWCAALLPRETRDLLLALRSRPTVALLQELGVLLLTAAVLVSCADLAFQWLGGGAVDARLKSDVISMSAWATNTLIVFSAYAFVFALTSRAATALLLISPLYALFVVADLAKIRYMHSAVQPLDLIRIPEFLPLFRSYFGTGVLVVSACAFVIWFGALVAIHRLSPARASLRHRLSIGLPALAVLTAFPAAFLS